MEKEMDSRIAKSLRRDFRAKLQPLIERARFIAAIDPRFREELDALGLSNILGEVAPEAASTDEAQVGRVQTLAENIGKKGEGQPAPLKSYRRTLRRDMKALRDELLVLRQLDPTIAAEVERLGLARALDSSANNTPI